MDNSEDTIFENKKKEFEKITGGEEEPRELESIPESDIEIESEPEEKKEPEKPVKKIRKKRELTDAQREALRERLKLAREKSLESRRKNRELKRIEKERLENENEEKILKSLELKRDKKKSEKSLMDEIAELRLKLKQKEEREIRQEPIKKEPIKSEPVKITGGLPPGFSGHIPKPAETQAQKNKRLYKQMRGLGR